MNLPPAEIGALIAEVETPALIVDLAALDRNIAKMAGLAKAAGFTAALEAQKIASDCLRP